MATLLPISSDKMIKECVDDDFLKIVWGPAINQDVFNSWAQGRQLTIICPYSYTVLVLVLVYTQEGSHGA